MEVEEWMGGVPEIMTEGMGLEQEQNPIIDSTVNHGALNEILK